MSLAHHDRLSELFARACELEPAQREAFLDEACVGDLRLRTEVESLLSHDATTAEILRTGALGSLLDEDAGSGWAQRPGDRIGRYEIVSVLGQGGMGIVYLAEQQGEIRRKVALKLIKWGMDTRRVLGRFESERQALAMLSHPNIAGVFDAGATEQGRPFFAMEHIEGSPITEYCDGNRLSIRERLDLFLQVCEGIQHAHQKGIIHRDIKPSNILVKTQNGQVLPKIIDFGVAKATTQRLTERTVATEFGQLIGTPAYMSPEQAALKGGDVDTRTDVYSLGILLYELLVGAAPFDLEKLRRAGWSEIQRMILEEEPPRPSTRLSGLHNTSSELARRRHANPQTLRRQMRGDLDWIVMKALEKDRARRYGSVAELAADIRRHLTHEPVVAGPPSTAYRARKFIRRHRVGVALAAGAVLLLAGFGVRERIQAKRIANEARTAEQALEFLTGLFEVSDPSEARGNSITAREILDKGAEKIDETLADQPEVQARMMHTMGGVYTKLGLYEQAEPLLEESLELRRSLLGGEHPDTLDSVYNLAFLYWNQSRYKEAEPLYLETLETQRRVLGEAHPDTLSSMNSLADLYTYQGRHDEAEPLYLENLETRRRVLGEDHPDTLSSAHNLANLYSVQDRYDEAELLFLETLEKKRRVLGDDHPSTLLSMGVLAIVYLRQGRNEEAEALHVEALETGRHVLGDEHPSTLWSMNALASVYSDQGRYEEAEPLYLETIEIRRRVIGDEHPRTLSSMHLLTRLYNATGELDKARSIGAELLSVSRKRAEASTEAFTKNLYAWTALTIEPVGLRDPDSALGFAIDANKLTGFKVPAYLDTLSLAYHLTGDTANAIENQKKAISLLPEGESALRVGLLGALVGFYKATGELDKARPIWAEMLSVSRKRAEASKDAVSKNTYAWTALTIEPVDLRDPDSALRFALAANEQTGYEVPNYLDTLALAYHLTGDTGKAIEMQTKALALLPEDGTNRREFEERLAEFEAALECGQD